MAQQQLAALDRQVSGLITINQSVIGVQQAIKELYGALFAQGQGAGLTGSALLNAGKGSSDPTLLLEASSS